MELRGPRSIDRWLAGVLAALAVATLALVVVRGWNRPFLPYDCWAYHLPFAARLAGIAGPDAFVFASEYELMFQGFPLFAEWLQGAFWRLTGSVRAVASVNSLGLAALTVYLAATFRLPLAALVFGFLAVPLVAIHATSGYIDLVVGVALAFQAAAALRLLELARDGEPASAKRRRAFAAHAFVFLAGAGAAGNSKVMGVPMAALFAGFLLVDALRRGLPRAARRGLVALAAAGVLVAGATVLRNVVRYSNPIHPYPLTWLRDDLSVPRPSKSERRAGEAATAAPAGEPAAAGPSPEAFFLDDLGLGARPVGFVLSATEVDWWLRGVEPLYNIDSNTGDSPRRGGGARTGGWWGAFVVAQLGLLGFEIGRRRRAGWSGRDRRAVALLALSALAIAATPISYLLRYWLFWPLLLVFTTTLLCAGRRQPRARIALSAALGAAFLVSYFALPSDADFSPRPFHRYDPAAMRARLEPALLAAIEEGRSFCLDGEHDPMQFRYSAAVVGGHHGVEQGRGPRPCWRYPLLEVPAPALRRAPTRPAIPAGDAGGAR